MAFVPTNNCAKVDVVWTWRSQAAVNTLWFEGDANYSIADLTGLAQGVASWLANYLAPLLSSDLACNLIRATAQEGTTAPSVEYVPSPTIVGGDADNSVTNNTAFVVTFSTSERGRGGRGRNYIPGIPANELTGNSLGVSYATNLVSQYNDLNPEVTGVNNSRHVIVSFQANGLALPTGVKKEVIAYRYADVFIDSQRRRLPGRGS